MFCGNNLWKFVYCLAVLSATLDNFCANGTTEFEKRLDDLLPENEDSNSNTTELGLNSRARGFGVVHEPVNSVLSVTLPTEVPCKCVPYHECNITNETTKAKKFKLDLRATVEECDNFIDRCCKAEHVIVKQANGTVAPLPETTTVAAATLSVVTVPSTEVNNVPVTPTTFKNRRPPGSQCGVRQVDGLDFDLVNNNNNLAGFGEFPWTVAMLRVSDGTFLGAGSLIHPRVVLTSHHNVMADQPKNIRLRAGEWDTQSTSERLPHQERVAMRIISHPRFDVDAMHYDVALLYLSRPFVLNEHIALVCLPQQNDQTYSNECIMTGWGKDRFGTAGKRNIFQKRVIMPAVANARCEQQLQATRLTDEFELHPSFMCAGGFPERDACEGDGGAPLVCPVGPAAANRYAQYGIVSWGIGCNSNVPGVYSRVAAFRDWIDQTMYAWNYNINTYTYST